MRGRQGSNCLRFVWEVARADSEFSRIDVSHDDYASLGRLCDEDDPFHVLVHEQSVTMHDHMCIERRFPGTGDKPRKQSIGEMRVMVVVHGSNPVNNLSLVEIGDIVFAEGTRNWSAYGGRPGIVWQRYVVSAVALPVRMRQA